MDWQSVFIAAIAGGALAKLIELVIVAVQSFFNRKQTAAQVHSTEADTAAKLQAVSISQGDEWRELYEEQKKRGIDSDERVSRLETEFRQTIKAEHARAAEQETKRLDEIKALREEINALRMELQAKDTRISELENKIKSLSGVHVENMSLKALIEKLQKDNDRLTKENEDLRAQIAALTLRLTKLEKSGTAPLTGNAEPTQSQ